MPSASSQKTAPGIRQALPLPYAWFGRYQQNPVATMLDGTRQFGDLFRLQLGPVVLHVLVAPEHVGHVLLDHVGNYQRGLLYYVFRPGVGSGLITTDGDAWRRQRTMADRAFEHHRIVSYANLTLDATGSLIDRWRAYAKSGKPFIMDSELLNLSLRILGKAVFGTDVGVEGDPEGRAITDMEEYVGFTMTHLHPPPMIPTSRNLRLKKALRTVDALIYRLIAERRRDGRDAGDVLSVLVAARDKESGEPMSDLLIRDNVMSLFLAGHETVGLTLTWMWYLLARNPEVEHRLHAELARVLSGRIPTLADLPGLPYTRQVLQETLRLYPSVWLFEREAINADEIGGYHIPAKSQIILVPFLTHRHERTWPAPDSFDPERFTPVQVANRHPSAYFPFCLGPHQCIGEHFAMMVMELIVATVAQVFHLELTSKSPAEPEGLVTVRPRGGVMVTAHER